MLLDGPPGTAEGGGGSACGGGGNADEDPFAVEDGGGGSVALGGGPPFALGVPSGGGGPCIDPALGFGPTGVAGCCPGCPGPLGPCCENEPGPGAGGSLGVGCEGTPEEGPPRPLDGGPADTETGLMGAGLRETGPEPEAAPGMGPREMAWCGVCGVW